MDVNHIHNSPKEIKFYLVFFCLVLILACRLGDTIRIEQIDYEDKKAVGVTFSTPMDVENIRVFLGEASQTSVIGVIVSENDKHQFTPVIPFTPGQTYTLRKMDTIVLATFSIPKGAIKEKAEILAIYPSLDTVPENLLKMYFEFAQPMQEVGNALDFITVTNETDGSVTQPFLRLESELWNKERTLLTLWLDPGRIKTDLIPNKQSGLPLTEGKRYTVSINDRWRSQRGVPLAKKYTKTFYVGPRDDKQPKVDEWQLQIQHKDTLRILTVDFGEPMDAFLAKETIKVHDSKGMEIKGTFYLEQHGKVLKFTPDNNWKSINYKLLVQSKLEDLAGNNLNHLFDTDLKKAPDQKVAKAMITIPFEVQ